MFRLLFEILKDQMGGTLAITRKTANTLITAAGFNTNFAEIEAEVNALDTENYTDGSVTAAKLASDAVETAKIKDANVTAAKLASDAVETAKIKDANVTAAKLATDAVETAKILDAAVTTAKILDANVTTAKIADANVTAAKLATDAVETAKIKDANVTTVKLKTATGEVSSLTRQSLTLPGGEYGFYPQVKVQSGGTGAAAIGGNLSEATYGFTSTSYITIIWLNELNNDHTAYAQQRYVTASSLDLWIFLLYNKNLRKIMSAYQAPDHPVYGNGGNFRKLQHPFMNYKKLSKELEIILVGYDMTKFLKGKLKKHDSLLTLINEKYLPNMKKTDSYKPLHTGLFIDEKPVMVKELPNYIKVRELVKI